MRIIAGKFRGRALTPVGKGDPGNHLRPTTDRVRESLFNVVGSGRFGAPFAGTRVLDLFAGTGALGIEALSRGAEFALFVETGRVGQRLIRENLALTGANGRILPRDATKLGTNPEAPFDLVFLDPPYGAALGQKALRAARDGGWLAEDALIIWEEGAEQAVPEGFDLLDRRRYGDTHLAVLGARGPEPADRSGADQTL